MTNIDTFKKTAYIISVVVTLTFSFLLFVYSLQVKLSATEEKINKIMVRMEKMEKDLEQMRQTLYRLEKYYEEKTRR